MRISLAHISPLLLSLSLGLSTSCLPQDHSLNSPGQQASLSRLTRQNLPEGQVQIQPGRRPGLRFVIQYPELAGGFRTQSVDCTRFSRFQVSVTGVGMATSLYPATADPAQNNSIPANGCTLTATISNVPSGESRVARIVPYDAAGSVIPGLTLSAVFDVTDNPTTVALNYKSTPAGNIIYEILNTRHDPVLATQINRPALQGLVDTLGLQLQGNYPTLPSGALPTLINQPALLQALVTNQGAVAQLNPANPAFVMAPGSVTGTISGLVSSDKVSIRVMDPLSTALANQSNGNFALNQNVAPGTWRLELGLPAGYTSNAPATVTVTDNGVTNLGAITLTPIQPVISSLGSATVEPGKTLTINGSHFHPNADGNTVVIGGVTVPASDITVVSSTQLQVKVPALPVGNTTVTVAVGTQTATLQPAVQIVPAAPQGLNTSNLTTSGFDLNWSPVNGATAYKVYSNGVLTSTINNPAQTSYSLSGLTAATAYPMTVTAVVSGVESNVSQTLNVTTLSNWTGWGSVGLTAESIQALAAPLSNPNLVWAGSSVGGTSQGGVWKCVNTGSGDTCTQMLPGTTSGTVQSLVLDPQNPNILLAGTLAKGIYRSTDAGANWTQIAAAAGLSNLNVRSLAIDPAHTSMIYAGTNGGGVFVSSDSGSTWTASNTGLASLNIGSLSLYNPASGPTVLYAGTSGAGVHRATADTLATTGWSTINNGLSFASGFFLSSVDVRALVAHPTNASRLYGAGLGGCSVVFICLPPGGPAGGFQVGVWLRDDPGNWAQIGRDATHGYPLGSADSGLANMNVMALAIDPLIPNNVYAATQGGIFRSTNAGTSWAGMTVGLPNPTITVNTLTVNPLRLYIGTTAGLFRGN